MTTPWGRSYLQPHPHTAWPLPWAKVMAAISTEGTPPQLRWPRQVQAAEPGGSWGAPVAWAAQGEDPAPLPGPQAPTRVLGPVQGTGTYRGVSSEARDGGKGRERPPAWPCAAAEAVWGLLGVERRGRAQALPEAEGPRGPAAPGTAPLSGLPRPLLPSQPSCNGG